MVRRILDRFFRPAPIVLWGLMAAAPAATAGDVMPVRGSVQFWTRDCRPGSGLPPACDLPAQLSDRLEFAGEVAKPAPGVSNLGYWTAPFATEDGLLRAKLEVYWRPAGGDGSAGWIAAQTWLTRQVGGVEAMPVAQCSQYLPESAPSAAPVGACGGFVTENGVTRQWGVTFYR